MIIPEHNVGRAANSKGKQMLRHNGKVTGGKEDKAIYIISLEIDTADTLNHNLNDDDDDDNAERSPTLENACGKGELTLKILIKA